MSDETNGNKKDRLDRVEQLVEVLVNDHIQFRDEHRQLLKAQVLLYDSVQKLAESQTATDQRLATLAIAQTQLAGAQQHTDEKLAALINIADSLIRRPPPPY
jgi:ribosomal protein L16 Arg81 hydroxylase